MKRTDRPPALGCAILNAAPEYKAQPLDDFEGMGASRNIDIGCFLDSNCKSEINDKINVCKPHVGRQAG